MPYNFNQSTELNNQHCTYSGDRPLAKPHSASLTKIDFREHETPKNAERGLSDTISTHWLILTIDMAVYSGTHLLSKPKSADRSESTRSAKWGFFDIMSTRQSLFTIDNAHHSGIWPLSKLQSVDWPRVFCTTSLCDLVHSLQKQQIPVVKKNSRFLTSCTGDSWTIAI